MRRDVPALAEMIPPPKLRSPRPNGRKPTNARACECGETWFAKTSFVWIAIVDAEDGKWLRDYKWTANGPSRDRTFYAKSSRYSRETGKSEKLHQAVTGHIHDQLDHVNQNGHDCRKVNLRPCTTQENQHNRKAYWGTSKFKGVFFCTGKGWQARIRVDGRNLYLGSFGFESDAAIAYNYHAAHYHGEFAKLNKITEYFHD